MSTNPIYVILCVLLGVTYSWSMYGLLWYYRKSARPRDYPPGPKPLPFLGNLNIIPRTKAFLRFHELGKQYGSIVGLKIGPQNVVILNDYKHVEELFDKRGAIYSSRPPSHINNDLIFQNKVKVLTLPYDNDWRLLRKALQDLLRIYAVDKLLPLQNAESTTTLYHLLRDPENWYDHIRRYSTAVILAGVYGLRGAEFDSPRVKGYYHIFDHLTQILEIGATPPVDLFPILKTLPDFLSTWKRWAMHTRTEYRKFFISLTEESRDHMKNPNAPYCFLQKLTEMSLKAGLDDEHVMYLASEMMDAGSDSTASTLLSFILAMAKHPQVLRNCQKEVDKICGTERPPRPQDFPALNYVRAVMNETLRWRPVVPGGVPHALTQDDYYEGYYFPKGTVFITNTWSIHRSDEYASPDDFIPERFLKNKFGVEAQGTEAESGKRRVQYIFGAGRRVCPGQRLATNSLMMNIAKIVWAFNIEAGAQHIDDDVASAYHVGLAITPKRFSAKITPRSPLHATVIEKEYEAQLPFLRTFKE